MRVLIALRLAAALPLLAAPAVALATPVQPADERSAQKALPQSHDALWATLKTTRIGEDTKRGRFTATPTPEVKALDGQVVTLNGFMLPLESQATTSHFLLSKYTPVCFFCPPGQPNEVVEVRTTKPLRAGYDRIKVTGRFTLQNDGEKGLFFRLDQASASR